MLTEQALGQGRTHECYSSAFLTLSVNETASGLVSSAFTSVLNSLFYTTPNKENSLAQRITNFLASWYLEVKRNA